MYRSGPKSRTFPAKPPTPRAAYSISPTNASAHTVYSNPIRAGSLIPAALQMHNPTASGAPAHRLARRSDVLSLPVARESTAEVYARRAPAARLSTLANGV